MIPYAPEAKELAVDKSARIEPAPARFADTLGAEVKFTLALKLSARSPIVGSSRAVAFSCFSCEVTASVTLLTCTPASIFHDIMSKLQHYK